jgi:hypothetical protein
MDDVAPLDDSARLVEGHRAEPFLAPYVRKSSSIVIALRCLKGQLAINRHSTHLREHATDAQLKYMDDH